MSCMYYLGPVTPTTHAYKSFTKDCKRKDNRLEMFEGLFKRMKLISEKYEDRWTQYFGQHKSIWTVDRGVWHVSQIRAPCLFSRNAWVRRQWPVRTRVRTILSLRKRSGWMEFCMVLGVRKWRSDSSSRRSIQMFDL